MDLVVDGLKLMIIGMGTVMVFLLVMILMIQLMAKILEPFKEWGIIPPKTTKKTNPTTTLTIKDDKKIIAVISSAITQFKNDQK